MGRDDAEPGRAEGRGRKADPFADFSDGDKQLIVNALLNACDAKDGVRDGLVSAPRAATSIRWPR